MTFNKWEGGKTDHSQSDPYEYRGVVIAEDLDAEPEAEEH
jgi:hypothetical protein